MLRTMFGYSKNNITLSIADVMLRVKRKVIKNHIGTDTVLPRQCQLHTSWPHLQGLKVATESLPVYEILKIAL